MSKKAMILLVSLLMAVPAMVTAKDMTGRLGFGYFNSDAPVGVRYWFTPEVGVDLGFGLDVTDLGDNSASSFWVEVGIPYVVYDAERANFFVRVGGTIGILDDRVFGSGLVDDTWTTVDISVGPGAEVFFGDNFSLEASHGINIGIISPPGGGDSLTNFGTFSGGVSELGFHFYF